MARAPSELKAFRFIWTNQRMGITDAGGTTHFEPRTRVVIAPTEKAARIAFRKTEERQKQQIRAQLTGHKNDKEISQLIRKVFHKNELLVQAYPIQEGLVL